MSIVGPMYFNQFQLIYMSWSQRYKQSGGLLNYDSFPHKKMVYGETDCKINVCFLDTVGNIHNITY